MSPKANSPSKAKHLHLVTGTEISGFNITTSSQEEAQSLLLQCLLEELPHARDRAGAGAPGSLELAQA